jgi:hypothetical protein
MDSRDSLVTNGLASLTASETKEFADIAADNGFRTL